VEATIVDQQVATKRKSNAMKYVLILFSGLSLLSCSEERPAGVTDNNKSVDPESVHTVLDAQISRGRQLYLKNCTVCHGINGEGSPDWRKRSADGTYPAPPLNGTGHAWHHPKKVLVNTIKNGTAKLGGKMPAWRDRLSDQDIDDIIVWFQSQWPDQIYEAWQRMDREAQNR